MLHVPANAAGHERPRAWHCNIVPAPQSYCDKNFLTRAAYHDRHGDRCSGMLRFFPQRATNPGMPKVPVDQELADAVRRLVEREGGQSAAARKLGTDKWRLRRGLEGRVMKDVQKEWRALLQAEGLLEILEEEPARASQDVAFLKGLLHYLLEAIDSHERGRR